MTLTRDDLRRGLHALGLRPGDRVMVHSSLKSFGCVQGGADTVIDALLAAGGPEGTVLVPAFTSGQKEPFDPDRSPVPQWIGTIPETLRQRPGAVRSLHPTHSIAALGREAADLCAGHDQTTAFGQGSPLDRLVECGGSVLLLGVGHIANSTIHVAERRVGVPYAWTRDVDVRDPDGTIRRVHLTEMPGHSGGFDKIDPLLRARGFIREMVIGQARARWMDARALVDVAVEMLRADPTALLCDNPTCPRCSEAREMMGNAD